jgi:dihydrofolate reductase
MPRKIVVHAAVSADGFIARSDGSVDWLDRPSPEHNYGMNAFYRSIDTILWGRKTYEVALEFQRRGAPGAGFDTRLKNYVFTRTLVGSTPPKGIEFVDRPIKDFVGQLRTQPGKDIWVMGGAGLIGSLLDEGEIDEFLTVAIPVLIGEGIPLIAPRHRTVPLNLLASQGFDDGVVTLHYSVPQESANRSSE